MRLLALDDDGSNNSGQKVFARQDKLGQKVMNLIS